MNKIEKQMKIADEILAKLETFDPTCILAGGAPRDWYFGKPATDLDFFVFFRPEAFNWVRQSMLENLGFKPVQKGIGFEDEFGNYKRNPHLISVYEFQYKGEKVQVMFMDEPTFTCVVNLFPFGICQAWYKGSDRLDYFTSSPIHTTRHFNESVNHKILRLLNDLYNDADGYIEKIRSKFPDYLYIGKE